LEWSWNPRVEEILVEWISEPKQGTEICPEKYLGTNHENYPFSMLTSGIDEEKAEYITGLHSLLRGDLHSIQGNHV
jgi:hypothetical protein